MKPFLFLDVDGVLAIARTNKTGTDLDDVCCRRLRRVIEEADPEVVLSSTWRCYPYLAKRIWRLVGKRCKATPEGLEGRGAQIDAFLKDYLGARRNYVILDDDVFDLLPHQLPFTVQTESADGLTDEKVEEILNLFKSFTAIDK